MAVNFPNSPTNGQTVVVDGVTYSWNAAERQGLMTQPADETQENLV